MTQNSIPLSDALSEASPDSLTVLMSRDPEGYSSQDLFRIVEALREQRKKFEAAEAKGKAKPSRVATPISGLSPEDLGI